MMSQDLENVTSKEVRERFPAQQAEDTGIPVSYRPGTAEVG